MPYVNIRITNEGVTAEQKVELIKGATDLLVKVLGKNPATTVVVIDEVETDNWGIGGETVTSIRNRNRQRLLYFDHMALQVHFENAYVVDVGFGDAFRKPISLKQGFCEDVSGKYRVYPQNLSQNSYIIQKQEAGNWQVIYRFTNAPLEIIDFNEMCRYNSNSPNSHFTQKTICTIAQHDGRLTLTDEHLITTDKGLRLKIPVTSQQCFKEHLLENFNIDYEKVQQVK